MTGHVIEFESLGLCFYTLGDVRPPKAGEYYVTGSIRQAIKAYWDLGGKSSYQILVPTHKAQAFVTYRKGDPITRNENGTVRYTVS